MKGIVLAGGSGTRLYPITKGVSKQLLPIYDKPMVYYPISVLMLAEIQDILIITTPEDNHMFRRLLGDGSQFGINIEYETQPTPGGIAQAFIIGEKFLGGESACLVLGDNIFHGAEFRDILNDARLTVDGVWDGSSAANIFTYWVRDPERYGVADFDDDGSVKSIEEKPACPKSNYAVTGLYMYPPDVVSKVREIEPSARGELEITTLNQLYLKEGRLRNTLLPRGFAWLDTGTFQSLSDASNYIETIENRTGLHVACLEEIAYRNEWINNDGLRNAGEKCHNSEYGQYLIRICERITNDSKNMRTNF